MATANAAVQARWFVLAAAFLFSTGGAAIKATSLNSWQVGSFRCAIAAIALLLLVPASRRLENWKNWRIIPIAVAYALTLLLFVAATKLTTAANAIFLQGTAPLFVLAMSPLLQEKLSLRDLALGAAIALGMGLFFLGEPAQSSTAPNPSLGNQLAAITGFTWASVLVGFRLLGRDGQSPHGGVITAVAGNLIGFLAGLPFALPAPIPAMPDIAALLYLGVFQVGLAYYCLGRGMRHVPAFEASALILLEPALNPVWTFLLHGERPGPLSLLGGGIILTATLGQAFLAQRQRRQ